MDTENTEIIDCSICGLNLKDKYQHKLSCNHIFHYECLLKTYQSIKKNDYKHRNCCPYCREKSQLLPVINGLKVISKGIHYHSENEKPELKCIPCKAILQKGKNKGNVCKKKCLLGFEYCGLHKKYIYES